MELVYLAGSIASILSVFAIVLGFVRHREAITEKSFKMLFSLVITITLVAIGALTMALGQENVVRNIGGLIAVIGAVLLFIVTIMVVYYSGEKE